jgi:hypothetical protein
MRTQFFSDTEFACKCGCGEILDKDILLLFMFKLDVARGIAGIPFVINSGHRCKKHNKEVGGEPDSAHLVIAADIEAETSSERFTIVDSLRKAGFSRIGLSQKFICVDDDKTKPKNLIWLYKDVK